MNMKRKAELAFEESFFPGAAREFQALEVPASERAFFFAGLLAVLVAGVALVRVFGLNILEGGFYVVRAESNVHREIFLPAARGVITDRFGVVLAANTNAFSVFLDVVGFLRNPNHPEEVLTVLAEVLSLHVDEVRERIRKADLEKESTLVLARNITASEAIAVRGLNLSFVRVGDDYVREYLDAPLFAHVVGYTGADTEGNAVVGKTGLEAAYDAALRGEDGIALSYRDATGVAFETRMLSEPRTGREFRTTIDGDLQRYFYERMRAQLATTGRRAGVGIALDPRNGEILALVSLPSFDSQAFVDRKRSEDRLRLLTDSAEPLFNRALAGVYSPGSTIKPLHAIAALKEGIVTPASRIFSTGSIEIPNPYVPDKPSRFLDWRPQGWVDLRSALARSSNIYFYAVGGGLPRGDIASTEGWRSLGGLGIERIRAYWEKFGFGVKTGIDLRDEGTGFLPSASEKRTRTGEPWRLGDTYNVSIGQGDLLVTPLQLLDLIASLGAGGKVYRPHVNKDVPAELVRDDAREYGSEIALVREGLRAVVAEPYGTAIPLRDLPIAVAGKTGSAQTDANTKVNAFFVGYAPDENPAIALLVLIENAREGSLNAIPVAKDVFEWYYKHRMQTDANNVH